MAYKPSQLDEHFKSQRARKLAKRSMSRKVRQAVRYAVRNGIDAIDAFATTRGHRFKGWAS